MQKIILTKIAPLILAATPISLILINQFTKLFSKYNPQLGNATTICTNVTKTLTKNELTVRTIFFDKFKATVENGSNLVKIEEKDEEILVEKPQLQKDQVLKLMAITANLCHYKKLKEVEETIIQLFIQCGFNKHKIHKDYEVIDKIPSHSEKKLSTIVALQNDTKEIFAFAKGHPSILLKNCTKILIEGKKVEIDNQMRRKIRKKIKQLNKNGQKAIGFAYKPLPLKRQEAYSEQFTENEMTFIGIIGITSPLKKDLAESIEFTKQAGIKTYILTSEKERKAIAIGKLLGIINPQYFEGVSGGFFRQLPDQKIAKMLSNKKKDYVFAELKEKDKLRIMKILKAQDEVVAIVRKNRKNGFQEVVEGIKKGRIINRNYRKVFQHAFSCKIAEFIFIAIALLAKAPTPLSITLILILDIFINLILELALRADRTKRKVMAPKYHATKKKYLSHVLINGISAGIILSAIYLWSLMRYGWTIGETIGYNETAFIKSATIAFVLLAIIQIVNALNLKNAKKSIIKSRILSNPYLPLTTIVSLLIIYIFVSFPILTKFLNLSRISSIEWEIVAFLAVIVILIEEFRKFLLRKS